MGCDCFCLSSRLLSGFFVARRCATTGAMGVQTEPGPSSCVSLRWLLGESSEFLARVVHTWVIWSILSSRLRIWQSHVLCLGVACGILDNEFFGRFCGCLAQQWIRVLQQYVLEEFTQISTSTWTRILRCFDSFSGWLAVCMMKSRGRVSAQALTLLNQSLTLHDLALWTHTLAQGLH